MTKQEILAAIAASPELQALAAVRNDGEIARIISIGKTKLVPTEIGSGTIMSTLAAVGIDGGVFLDTLVTIGGTNRSVFWTVEDLIKQGRFRIDLVASRAGLSNLAQAVPALLPAVTQLLTLGYEPDPVLVDVVSAALNGV